MPFAIKDNIDLAGIITTAACPAFASADAKRDHCRTADCPEGGAGGQTNLDQFATGLNRTRSPYGRCRNAATIRLSLRRFQRRSAAAVAGRRQLRAGDRHRRQQVRVPEGLNNTVGLKATKGLISTAGVVPACRTLDCVTFFSATADEASQLLALVCQADPQDSYSRRNPPVE